MSWTAADIAVGHAFDVLVDTNHSSTALFSVKCGVITRFTNEPYAVVFAPTK